VTIEALCLFDTVASLGIPKVGAVRHIASVVGIFSPFRKDYAHFESIVRSPPLRKLNKSPLSTFYLLTIHHAGVRHVFHAVSIHETRATYGEQLAYQQLGAGHQILKQMWFLGNHGHIGQDNGRSCLADAPLAWMVAQLHHSLGLRFDEDALHRRFPSYPETANIAPPIHSAAPPSSSSSSLTATSAVFSNSTHNLSIVSTDTQVVNASPTGAPPEWIQDEIKAAGAFKTFFHGWNQRSPGRYGQRTSEEIHLTVRLRGFGLDQKDSSMVPGYQLSSQGGRAIWIRLPPKGAKSFLWVNGDKKPKALPYLNEGTMLQLEAALLGRSWCLE
jgi:hypothetical protein